jgi:fumarate hydratase, class II
LAVNYRLSLFIMTTRLEKDAMGLIAVSQDAYWGAQTQRSLKYFNIGTQRMPEAIIVALLHIKREAAKVNCHLGVLTSMQERAIVSAVDALLTADHQVLTPEQFPLKVWQTGSGTQTNMNVNEVVANWANVHFFQQEKGLKMPIHPNDHVNASQSSNDVFPTAIHIAVYQALQIFQDVLKNFHQALCSLEERFSSVLRMGRTHGQDAVPMTMGQMFSGYAAAIAFHQQVSYQAMDHLRFLALGGTAVGTGLNAPPTFAKHTIAALADVLKCPFEQASNLFMGLASHEPLVFTSQYLKNLATTLFKIANDIRWLASGPRCGLNELILPANEPGSSIMPGKINPTQCEAMTMVCAYVLGLDATVGFANTQGQCELNVFKPLIGFAILESIHLLSDAMLTFQQHCLEGMQVNEATLQHYVQNSLMCVTALNSVIGYEQAARAVQHAQTQACSLREACLALQLLSAETFDQAVNPWHMAHANTHSCSS